MLYVPNFTSTQLAMQTARKYRAAKIEQRKFIDNQIERKPIVECVSEIREVYKRPGEFKLNGRLTNRGIIRMVGRRYRVGEKIILSKAKAKFIVRARWIAIFFCLEESGGNLSMVGRDFSMDHSSILHSRRKMIARIVSDDEFRMEIEQVRSEINAAAITGSFAERAKA